MELPEGGKQLFCCFSYVFEIYADKKRNIYFNENKLGVQELKNALINEYTPGKWSPRMYFYADKNLKYNFIDSVKSEMAKSLIAGNITYVTKSRDTLSKYGVQKVLFKPVENIPKNRIKKPIYGIIDTTKSGIPQILEFERNSIQLFFDNLYDLNIKGIKNYLSKIKYGKIYFNGGEFITIERAKLLYTDIEKIGNEMSKYEFLFIEINENITYQDYVKMSESIRKSYFFYAKKDIGLPEYFEITNNLKGIFQKYDIQL